MNRRLQQFLSAENISQSQFADRIGVARASVSHIMAGRNKPGFDFIESMARQFPTLNLDWLIMGKGKMYRESLKTSVIEESSKPDLHKDTSESYARGLLFPEESENNVFQKTGHSIAESVVEEPSSTESETLAKQKKSSAHQRYISHITVFYNDGTYQELK